MKIKCPCCGYYTLDVEEPKFDICPVCFWENDPFQTANPEETGANKVSLSEAKENFIKYGAVEERLVQFTREALPEEVIQEDVHQEDRSPEELIPEEIGVESKDE